MTLRKASSAGKNNCFSLFELQRLWYFLEIWINNCDVLEKPYFYDSFFFLCFLDTKWLLKKNWLGNNRNPKVQSTNEYEILQDFISFFLGLGEKGIPWGFLSGKRRSLESLYNLNIKCYLSILAFAFFFLLISYFKN